jgi:hypothetical protein
VKEFSLHEDEALNSGKYYINKGKNYINHTSAANEFTAHLYSFGLPDCGSCLCGIYYFVIRGEKFL